MLTLPLPSEGPQLKKHGSGGFVSVLMSNISTVNKYQQARQQQWRPPNRTPFYRSYLLPVENKPRLIVILFVKFACDDDMHFETDTQLNHECITVIVAMPAIAHSMQPKCEHISCGKKYRMQIAMPNA